MRIREARTEDAGSAAALWTEAYSGAGPGEGRVEPYAEGDFEATAAAASMLVAEFYDGAVVGVVALRSPGSPALSVARDGEAELARLAVAAAVRRRGVGRALSAQCLELARQRGASGMALWSRPYQVEAHSLYESLGFHRAPERDGRDPDGERRVFTISFGGSR